MEVEKEGEEKKERNGEREWRLADRYLRVSFNGSAPGNTPLTIINKSKYYRKNLKGRDW